MNITITEKAATYMRRMIRFNGGTASSGFRLVVTPGGCSGFNSSFTVEAAPLEGDTVLDNNGIKVFLPAESRILLEGVTVDFADTTMATGLSFINPECAVVRMQQFRRRCASAKCHGKYCQHSTQALS